MSPMQIGYGAVAAAMLGLGVTVAVQQARIGSLRASLAQAEAQVASDRAASAKVAQAHAEALAALQATHAARQQEAEHAFAMETARLVDARRDDADLVRRMRAQLTAAGRRPAGPTDPAAVQRRADASGDLAGLLGEGVELVVEGRRLVEQRDAEVSRLLDQIKADRAACGAAPG